MGAIGPEKIILILLVVTLLFGAKRIPEIGSSLGKGIREFKASLSDGGSHPTLSTDRTGQAGHAEERSTVPERRDESSRGPAGQPKRLLE